jgi:hypothetical protein
MGWKSHLKKTVASFYVRLSRSYNEADPIGPTVAPLQIEYYPQ